MFLSVRINYRITVSIYGHTIYSPNLKRTKNFKIMYQFKFRKKLTVACHMLPIPYRDGNHNDKRHH